MINGIGKFSWLCTKRSVAVTSLAGKSWLKNNYQPSTDRLWREADIHRKQHSVTDEVRESYHGLSYAHRAYHWWPQTAAEVQIESSSSDAGHEFGSTNVRS